MPSKKKESLFKEIISQVKQPEPPTLKQATQTKEVSKALPKRDAIKSREKNTATTAPPAGRRGKSSDPDYTQATLYIRRDTHHEIKTKLLAERHGRDMSDLAEELFAQWLQLTV